MNKKYIKNSLVILFLGISLISFSQIITTIAGNGIASYSGDGGQATAAELNYPQGIAVDASGNIYFADWSNNRIRVVNSSGVITTFAGNGIAGHSGNGGPATAAELFGPADVVLDKSGNLYIADANDNRIRLVNTSGIISTFAGNGVTSFSGDGGQATAAELDNPTGVTVDSTGNLYIADEGNYRVRIINTSGIISTIAGTSSNGYSGDGGPATTADLNLPMGVAVDSSGNVYIADYLNHRIRKVNTSGTISTFAGNGDGSYSGDGGLATAAELYYPSQVKLDASGNLYIADYNNNRIRIVNTSGIINTFAGNGTASFSGDGGQATAAELNGPFGVALNASGNVYIGDLHNSRVRKIIVGTTTGVNNFTLTSNEVNIYPIPNTGSFTISGISQGQIIELYNYLGQKIETQCVTSLQSNIHFDIFNYPNGIYLIRILNKDGSVDTEKKMVKTE